MQKVLSKSLLFVLALAAFVSNAQQKNIIHKKGKLEVVFPILVKESFNNFNNIGNENTDTPSVRLAGEPLIGSLFFKSEESFKTYKINWKDYTSATQAVAFQTTLLARLKVMATKMGLQFTVDDEGDFLTDKIKAKSYYFSHPKREKDISIILDIMKTTRYPDVRNKPTVQVFIVQLSIMGLKAKDVYESMADVSAPTAPAKTLSLFSKQLVKLIGAFDDTDKMEAEVTKNKAAWLTKNQLPEGAVSKIFDAAPGRSAWTYQASWSFAKEADAKAKYEAYAKRINEEVMGNVKAEDILKEGKSTIWNVKNNCVASVEYFQPEEKGKWVVIVTIHS